MDTSECTSFNERPNSTHQAVTFSNLPFELRIAIFKLAIPLSRVLRMRLVNVPESGVIRTESMSAPCIPTILHINHESRTVGLSIFRRSFGDSPDADLNDETNERFTYWNPHIDTLFLPFHNPDLNHPVQQTTDIVHHFDDYDEDESEEDRDSCLVGSDVYHQRSLLKHVQHIALPVNHKTGAGFGPGPDYHPDEDYLPSWLEEFPHLKSVTMLDDPYPRWYRAGEILLHEPAEEDPKSLRSFRNTEDVFVRGLERFVKENGWDGEAPSLEMLIMTNRKTRAAPSFCIRPRKTAGA